ncbi:solute carrier family 51 subunit beta [Triplophysa rosa]|uniref:Ricin B lectin domain-containing protein n=1 Tax=Triplophysa rosa TaxID=992332 RepID=A0A9W7X5J8_TRIRA|nr:solute carrier family 51 subunit beta [Triplophysa rosa]KAI7814418.1 hypothetical protein IRJ41_017860 [Triplophysa rosa]
MLLLWITLCFAWPGAMGFMIRSVKEGLCLEDGLHSIVRLKECEPDSEHQQWFWTDKWYLVNTGTFRCLSSLDNEHVQATACYAGDHIRWRCEAQQILSLRNSLALSAEGGKVSLVADQHKWTTLDGGDICQNKMRSKRQSHVDFESDFEEPDDRMTEEQVKFLQWYYRTEDRTSWTFAMLGFAFLGLLIGCMLLVMGMMGNRSRKQIAKYRASTKVMAVKPEMEELQVMTKKITEEKTSYVPLMQNSHTEDSLNDSKVTEELKPGEILVTWKDGNVSTLYPEPIANDEVEESHIEGQDMETLSPNTHDSSL